MLVLLQHPSFPYARWLYNPLLTESYCQCVSWKILSVTVRFWVDFNLRSDNFPSIGAHLLFCPQRHRSGLTLIRSAFRFVPVVSMIKPRLFDWTLSFLVSTFNNLPVFIHLQNINPHGMPPRMLTRFLLCFFLILKLLESLRIGLPICNIHVVL